MTILVSFKRWSMSMFFCHGLHAIVYPITLPHSDLRETVYCKFLKYSDTQKIVVITLKVEQDGFSLRVMHPKDAEGIANGVDPDHTAPLGAVLSNFCTVCPGLSV